MTDINRANEITVSLAERVDIAQAEIRDLAEWVQQQSEEPFDGRLDSLAADIHALADSLETECDADDLLSDLEECLGEE